MYHGTTAPPETGWPPPLDEGGDTHEWPPPVWRPADPAVQEWPPPMVGPNDPGAWPPPVADARRAQDWPPPLSAEVVAQRPSPIADRRAPGPRPFLVATVDDDPAEHLLMSMAAAEAGIDAQIVYYNSGEALLEDLDNPISASNRPDVVLLDLRLPGQGGLETLEALKRNATLCDIPVVVYTSSSRAADRQQSIDRGAAVFQVKPPDIGQRAALLRGLPLLRIDGELVEPS